MKERLPVEERVALLERETELQSLMLSALIAYLGNAGGMSLHGFEAMLRRLPALAGDRPADTMFRRAHLAEFLAEARAVWTFAGPATRGDTSPSEP